MANITIAKRTSRPIWSKGAMAFSIDFSTTCKPEHTATWDYYKGVHLYTLRKHQIPKSSALKLSGGTSSLLTSATIL